MHALDESGAAGRALEEYAALVNYYRGAEARARELLAALLNDARLAPNHFLRSEREWIELARRESASA